jgi:hypothetical protein
VRGRGWPGPTAVIATALWVATTIMSPQGGDAQTVTSRFPEGATRGFLVLRSTDDRAVAYGELVSLPKGDLVQSRLLWRFRDGSLQDETTVYAQRPELKLVSYKQIQRGPAFPADVEVSFTRDPGHYEVRRKETKDGKTDAKPEVASGAIELPPDVYNGMTLTVLKNLAPGASGTGHMLAFTPKPRLVRMTIRPVAEDPVILGETRRTATRYLIDLEIGGIAGIFAAAVGKEPPDLRYWIIGGEAPAFVKFEGPFFLNGPVWRIEMLSPRWPKA